LAITLKTNPFEALRRSSSTLRRKETLRKTESVRNTTENNYKHLKEEALKEEKFEDSMMSDQTSILALFEEDFVKAPNTFFEDNIVSSFELQFLELESSRNLKDESGEMNTYGLWRLEPQNIFKGGAMSWGHPYRLKNIASGKYLKVAKKAANVLQRFNILY